MIIKPYSKEYRNSLVDIWEKSVLTTHQFLEENDFVFFKELVSQIDFESFDVHCIIDNEKTLGFIGIDNHKIEMLFIYPEYIGKGIGKKLIEFAINEKKCNKVDVNEQNILGFNFYQKFGFKVIERTDLDDTGRPYPILRMSL